MCTYFDYEEVRKVILKDNPGNIWDILDGDSGANRTMMKAVLDLWERNANGDWNHGLDEPLFEDIFLAQDSIGQDKYQLNLEKLSSFLTRLRRNVSKDIVDAAAECIGKATYHGKAILSQEQIREILLFGVLFVYVQREPQDRDFQALQAFLSLDETGMVQERLRHCREMEVERPSMEFPCFMGAGEEKQLYLEILVIRNGLNQPALITLKDCPLQRHLAPKEELLALMADGAVVTFLPRMCMTKNWAVRQSGDSLLAEKEGKTRTISLEGKGRVFFSESDRYGFMAADRNENFHGKRFKGKEPGGKICWLKGDLQNYGFLLPDGSYCGHLAFKGWDQLLFFDLSGGSGIAVTADRTAIDGKGKVLGENIAAVSCCGQQYILLRMDGTVTSDQGKLGEIPAPARAVCADRQGYWVSTDNTLFYWDGAMKAWQQAMDEMERDNTGTYVGGISPKGDLCVFGEWGRNV